MFGLGILTYVKIGVAVAVLAVLGYFAMNYSHLRTENKALKVEVVTLKRVNEIYAKDAVTDREINREKTRVDGLTPAELAAEYDRLRSYGTKGGRSKP
jgi:hypothetical protein